MPHSRHSRRVDKKQTPQNNPTSTCSTHLILGALDLGIDLCGLRLRALSNAALFGERRVALRLRGAYRLGHLAGFGLGRILLSPLGAPCFGGVGVHGVNARTGSREIQLSLLKVRLGVFRVRMGEGARSGIYWSG